MKKWVTLCLLVCLLVIAQTALAEVYQMPYARISDTAVKRVINELTELPAGTQVDLTGVNIGVRERAQMVTALPQLTFVGDVAAGKITIPLATETLDLDSLSDSRYSRETLRAIFTCLPNLKHVTMFNQKVSISDMEENFELYPGVTFDWTVPIANRYRVRTDATAFSTLKWADDPKRFNERDLEPLKYCKDLVAIDLGHNSISDLSFLTQWPHLKVLIIVDSRPKKIVDLSPLAELNELEYVELFMEGIVDVSPLANKPNLVDLNLCHNKIVDITPLQTDTKLERLWITYNPDLTDEQIAAFQTAVPDCLVETECYHSTGNGWREHPRHEAISYMFNHNTYVPFAEADAQ